MQKHYYRACMLAIGLAVLLSQPPFACAAPTHYELDTENSSVSFTVDSTLHKVHGTARPSPAAIDYDPLTGETALPFALEFPVVSMTTENDARDAAMRKMFEAEEFPAIRWDADSVVCSALDGEGLASCRGEGTLQIRSVKKGIAFPIAVSNNIGSLVSEGRFTIRTDRFGLKPPSVLGIIRVRREVTVEFEAHWKEIKL